jgi:hypothetical protein
VVVELKKFKDNVESMGEMRKACRILVGKPKENSSVGRHRHREEYNIRRDLKETGWEGVKCMYRGSE